MKKAIIIFTRVPEAGKTKTRMMPYLSPWQCAKLHSCFLKDILTQCERSEADIFVSYAALEAGEEKLIKILGRQVGYFPQKGDTLGEKMFHALEYVLNIGYDACLLLGTDVPEVRTAHLMDAFRVLEKKAVVFGPSCDGGYYLVGMKKPCKEIFDIEQYGHRGVLRETVRILKGSGITVGYTAALHDMDEAKDLRGYRERMRDSAYLKDSDTGRCLAAMCRISIIVPVYNEAKMIHRLQQQLLPLRKKCEIIFVDGGSTDGTLKLINPVFTVLHSPKGRADQMNLGAQKSCGDILFFLHCDSDLPSHPLAEIRRVMRDYWAGCFGIAFYSKNFFMMTCRIISNHRIKDRKVMFGDQGIFVDRELFFEAGMYPILPIMEDYQFSLSLKERGVVFGMTKRRIYTSDRRFPKGTLPKLRLMWKMNRLRKMYRDGVPATAIEALYEDIR